MGRVNRSTFFLAVAALGACSIFPAALPGHAANLRATPSIALEETWDTNIFNTSSGEESDFISRATPGLTLSLDSERTRFDLSGFLTSEMYADHNDLNSGDATKRVELSAARLAVTPRLSLRAAARFIETNDTFQRNELVLSPIEDLPPVETFVLGRTATRLYGGSAQATYQATPKLNVGIGGGGTKTEYPDETGLTGSRTVSGSVSGGYLVSPRTTGGVTGSTAYTASDDGSNSRSYSGGLTVSFATTENTGIAARVGMTFLTETRADGVVNHEQSPTASLSINYREQRFGAALTGSYELTGGGSFGQATDRTNASLTLTNQVTPKWSWDVNGHYQNERTAGARDSQKIETVSGTAGVRYAAARWLAFRLAGSTFHQWNRGPVGADIARNNVMLSVTLSKTYPLF